MSLILQFFGILVRGLNKLNLINYKEIFNCWKITPKEKGTTNNEEKEEIDVIYTKDIKKCF